jgi:hypothetical protein
MIGRTRRTTPLASVSIAGRILLLFQPLKSRELSDFAPICIFITTRTWLAYLCSHQMVDSPSSWHESQHLVAGEKTHMPAESKSQARFPSPSSLGGEELV